jgi:riboflavin-specific deaminase-like protein
MTSGFQNGAADSPFAWPAPARGSGPFVIAQLGQSLDGRIATPTGDSRWINGPDALDHLHRLRAAVDAVVVGVGTVVADNPRLDVRRVPGASPARVVIDPGGRTPRDALFFRADGVRRIVVTSAVAGWPDGAEIVHLARDPTGALAPQAILAALGALGFRRILIEGGAGTISRFIDAGAVDRLHLLVGQVIIGSGQTGLMLNPIGRLTEARRPRVGVHPFADGDVLFDCDLTGAGSPRAEAP